MGGQQTKEGDQRRSSASNSDRPAKKSDSTKQRNPGKLAVAEHKVGRLAGEIAGMLDSS